MKKLFVMLLAVMLLLSGITVFAESETFDMPHDTAIVFVDGVQYDLVLDSSADTGKGYLTAVYTSDNGEMLSIAVSDSAGENYYAAGPGAADMGTFIFYFSDGSKIYCSASEYGHERGYPCEMAVTAFDRDGWYQVLGMGTAMNKDTGDTYEFTAGADFMLNGGTVPAVAAAAAAPVEEGSADDETFDMPHDTAIVFVDGVQYDLVLESTADTGKGYLTAVYTSDNGEMLSIAVSDTAGENYYTAGPGAADMGTFIFYFSDGSKIYCSASDYGHERGYPCEMAVSAFDRDGWYQVLGMGTAMNKDTGDTYEFTAAADFILNGGTVPVAAAEPVEEEPAGDSDVEPLDIPHGVAILFIDGVEHDFNITAVENSGKGYINAIFSNDNGEMFGAAISDSVTEKYYAVGEGADDMGTFMYVMSDGTSLVSSCSDYGYTNGYPCEMGFSVYNDNGWYQVVGIGTLMNKDTGDTYKMSVCVDFVWDDAPAAK